MKNLARLALFFSSSFAILCVLGAVFRFLALRVEWLRQLPQQPEALLTTLIAAVRWALSLALYGAVLLSLGYTARRRVFAPFAVVCILTLSLGFGFGILLAIERWETVPPAQSNPRVLGEAGLILTRANTSVILLDGPRQPRGARVTVIPGRPLLYQKEPAGPNNSVVSIPPLPLGSGSPWFLGSIAIDFRLSAGQMQNRFLSGSADFFIYAGALLLFLCALGFVFKISAWPLANLFLGCLAFRGVLALETFFNSPEMRDVFGSFLGGRFPPPLIVPLLFCGFALLVYVYSILVYLAKRRAYEED